MRKVINLDGKELEKLFQEAVRGAVQEHFAAGRSVVGSEDEIIYRYYPDGTKTEIGKVSPTL